MYIPDFNPEHNNVFSDEEVDNLVYYDSDIEVFNNGTVEHAA